MRILQPRWKAAANLSIVAIRKNKKRDVKDF